MMHWRNNYACIDVGILYRHCLTMCYIYTHDNSAQSIDSSEQTIVMRIQKVSYRIGLFIDNDYKSATKLHNSNETYLRRWEKVELKARKIAWTKQKSCFIVTIPKKHWQILVRLTNSFYDFMSVLCFALQISIGWRFLFTYFVRWTDKRYIITQCLK